MSDGFCQRTKMHALEQRHKTCTFSIVSAWRFRHVIGRIILWAKRIHRVRWKTQDCVLKFWFYYAPAPNRRGIKRCFSLTSDVCLSVAYIGRNSRTERPRKTKISTEVAHVTSDSDTTFKVKRSKVKVTRPLWLVVLAGQHGHTVMLTYPYAYMTYIVSPLACLGGAYRGGRPPTTY